MSLINNPNMSIELDKWNIWSDKSCNIDFISTKKNIGNGEEKLAKELDILEQLGGQNKTYDMEHPIMGKISVKDMTKDDCILGINGTQRMRVLFRHVVYPLLSWCEKYRKKCEFANDIYNQLNSKYGRSRNTILNGIDRFELSKKNFTKLNNIVERVATYARKKEKPESLNSEYIFDVCKYLGDATLNDMANKCVVREATELVLIVVHETNGWMAIGDLSKITCPRITRGSPRINVSFS